MKRLLLAACLSTAIATVVVGCATTTSPTGRTQTVGAVSQQQLNAMGVQAFNQAKAQKPQSGDARQNAYVRCVVNAITRELPSNGQYAWETALFVDTSPNAFALPGGKVGLYTGIFPQGFEEMPAYLGVHERVVNHLPLPMPPFLCQVEGEMGTISAADQQLITQWLQAAAPDGANFP